MADIYPLAHSVNWSTAGTGQHTAPASVSKAKTARVSTRSPTIEPELPVGDSQSRLLSRQTYFGSLWRNFIANIMPALYTLLSRLWIAAIDPTYVAVAASYSYVGALTEVIAEGFPRAAWKLLADTNQTLQQRWHMAWTLILLVLCLDTLFAISILAAAPRLAATLVPQAVRSASVTYIRLGSVSMFCSVAVSVLSVCARALDEPDIPMAIQIAKFILNIIVDLLFISRFRVTDSTPTVNTQALTRLSCDVLSTLLGLLYFVTLTRKRNRQGIFRSSSLASDGYQALRRLLSVGWPFQVDVIVRMVLNFWLSVQIVNLSATYAQAWGVFTTARIGVLFAPLLAVETSCYTFVGHAWGNIEAARRLGTHLSRPMFRQVFTIILVSASIIASVEITMFAVFSFEPGRRMMLFLAQSTDTADLALEIWRKTDWGYIFLAIFFQTTSIILIAKPTWYLYQSLLTNIGIYLPFLILADEKMAMGSWRWPCFILSTAAIQPLILLNNLSWTMVFISRLMKQSDARTRSSNAG